MSKIHPSSFAKPVGQTLDASFFSSCPRYLSAQDIIPRTEIDPIYQMVGGILEEKVYLTLKQDLNIKTINREVVVKKELAPTVMLTGRADFHVTFIDGTSKVIEVKSTLSRGSYTNQINKGQLRISHLGQLLTYMQLLEVDQGILWMAYVHFDRTITQLEFEERKFHIRTENDKIFVDGQEQAVTLPSLFKFYSIITAAHTQPELPPRPIQEFTCLNCPLYKICEKSIKDKAELFREIKYHLKEGGVSSNIKTRPVQINNHHTKKVKL